MHITSSGEKLVTLIRGDGIGPEVVGAARAHHRGHRRPDRRGRLPRPAPQVFKRGVCPRACPHETIDSIADARGSR